MILPKHNVELPVHSLVHENSAEHGWDIYFDYIYDVFPCVKEKTVLEIGPFYGNITDLYHYFSPAAITLVEPNQHAAEFLNNDQYNNATVVCDDINFYLRSPRPHDIVVCFGVLYHMHSPLHLLELIVNNVNPKLLLLETTGVDIQPNSASMILEENNIPGNRYTNSDWKYCGYAMAVAKDVIIKAMMTLGYTLTTDCRPPSSVPYHKASTNLFVFQRNE
jgi:hypothetical protein